jgi:hypothetical protein
MKRSTALAEQLTAAMSTQPEPVRTIAARLGWDVMDAEHLLYELAGVRPGQVQPEDVGTVVNHRAVLPGVPVLWSLRESGDLSDPEVL